MDKFSVSYFISCTVVQELSYSRFFFVRSYNLGVNAYVVKPVDFQEFMQALKELGFFWAVINQPPPGSVTRTR